MRSTKTNKSTVETNHRAEFIIEGVLTSVFEGKNKNYLDIRVDTNQTNPNTGKPYYNLYSVSVEKNVELFDDNTPVKITGTVNTFFDRETKKTTTYLTGETVSKL